MFTHASNLDPVIVASGPYAFKWIAKRSLFRVPFFGWTLAGWGHIAIDRNDRTKAMTSLQHAVHIIHKYQRCLAISPEGTRSKTGRLQDFKKGPFHTSMAINNPIIPILIIGAYELWPPGQLFPIAGEVRVRLLTPILIQRDEDHNQLSQRVRRAMLEGLAQPMTSSNATIYAQGPLYLAWLPITLFILTLIVRWSWRFIIH